MSRLDPELPHAFRVSPHGQNALEPHPIVLERLRTDSTLPSRIPNRRAAGPKSIVALLLTFTAGYVDIVGLLTIYKLFAAHVTGTTVRLGEQLLHHNWKAAEAPITIVFAFLIGAVIGHIVIEVGARHSIQRIATPLFAAEAALLVGLIVLHARILEPGDSQRIAAGSLAMLASAMGLQTATLSKIGPLTIHTTFVTGMINELAQLVGRWISQIYQLLRNASQPHLRKLHAETGHGALLIFGIWTMYLVGAIFGAWLAIRWQLKSLFVPCGLLMIAIAVDQAVPLAIEEEKQELKK